MRKNKPVSTMCCAAGVVGGVDRASQTHQYRSFHQRGGGGGYRPQQGGGQQSGGGYAPRAPPLPQRGRGGSGGGSYPNQQGGGGYQQQQQHSYGYSRGGSTNAGGMRGGGQPVQPSRGGYHQQQPTKVADNHVCGNGDTDYQNFGFGSANASSSPPTSAPPASSTSPTSSKDGGDATTSNYEEYSTTSSTTTSSRNIGSSSSSGGGEKSYDFSKGLFGGGNDMAELHAAQQQAALQGPSVSQLHYANALPFQHYLAEAKKRCHPERNYYEPLISFIGDVTTALFDFIVPVIDTNQQQQQQALLQRKAMVEQQQMNPGISMDAAPSAAFEGMAVTAEGGSTAGSLTSGAAMATVGPIYNRLERLPQISGYHAKYQHKLGSMDSLIAFFDGLFFETMDVLAVWTTPPNSLSITPIPTPVVYQGQGVGGSSFASTTSATPTGLLTTTTYAFDDDEDTTSKKRKKEDDGATLPPLHRVKRKGISAPHGLVLLNKSLAVPTASAHLPAPTSTPTPPPSGSRTSSHNPSQQLTAADYSRRSASGSTTPVHTMMEAMSDMQSSEPQAVAVVSRPYFISTSSSLSSTNTQLCRRVDSSVRLYKGRVSRKLLYSRLLYPLLAIDSDFHTNSSDTVKALDKQKDHQRRIETFWREYFAAHDGAPSYIGMPDSTTVAKDWEAAKGMWDKYVLGEKPSHPSGKEFPHPTMAPIPSSLVDLATRALQGRLFDGDVPAAASSTAGTTANQYAAPPRPTRGSSNIAPPPPPSAGGRGRHPGGLMGRGGGQMSGGPNQGAADDTPSNALNGASSDEVSIALQFDYLFELGFGPLHSLMLDCGRGEFRMAPVPAGSHRTSSRMSGGRDSGSAAGNSSTDFIAMYTPMVLPPLPLYRHHIAELRGVLPLACVSYPGATGGNTAAQFLKLSHEAVRRYLFYSISEPTPIAATATSSTTSPPSTTNLDRRVLLDPFFNNTYHHLTGGNASANAGASSSGSSGNTPTSGTSSLFSSGLASSFSAQQVTISHSDVQASMFDWMKSSPHELAAERVLLSFINSLRSSSPPQSIGQGSSAYVPLLDLSDRVIKHHKELFPALSLLHPTSKLTFTPKPNEPAPTPPLPGKPGQQQPVADEIPSQPTQIRVKIFVEGLCALFPLHTALVFPEAPVEEGGKPKPTTNTGIPTGLRVRNAWCAAEAGMPEPWLRYLSTYVRPLLLPHSWSTRTSRLSDGDSTASIPLSLESLLGAPPAGSKQPLLRTTFTDTEAARILEARLGWRHDAARSPFKTLPLSRHPDNIRAAVRLQPALERTIEFFATMLVESSKSESGLPPKQAALLSSFSWLLDSILLQKEMHILMHPHLQKVRPIAITSLPPPLLAPRSTSGVVVRRVIERRREALQLVLRRTEIASSSTTPSEQALLDDVEIGPSPFVLNLGDGGPLLHLVANGFSPEAVLRFKSLYRIAISAADAGHLGREFQATFNASDNNSGNDSSKQKPQHSQMTPHQRRKQEAETKRLQVLKELGDCIGLNNVVVEDPSHPQTQVSVDVHLQTDPCASPSTTCDEEALLCDHLVPTAASFGGRMKDELMYSSMVTRLQQRVATDVLQRKNAKRAVRQAEEELEALHAVSRAGTAGGGGTIEVSNDVTESEKIVEKAEGDAQADHDEEDFFATAAAHDTMAASLRAANRVLLFPNHTDVVAGDVLLRAAEVINASSKGTETPILPLLEVPLQTALAEAIANSSSSTKGKPFVSAAASSSCLLEVSLIEAIPSVPVSVCELSRVLGVPLISLFNSIQFISASRKKQRDALVAAIRAGGSTLSIGGERNKVHLVKCHDGADALVWVERS